MTLSPTTSEQLQKMITRQHNQIQALVSCNLFLVERVMKLGRGEGLSPAELEILEGQLRALHTIKTANSQPDFPKK